MKAATKDFGLDLAVIGNGRTAALVDPLSRIVWWCYPRFDGDPIFSRLVVGDEEKGFADVLLDGMVDLFSEYVRNTAGQMRQAWSIGLRSEARHLDRR